MFYRKADGSWKIDGKRERMAEMIDQIKNAEIDTAKNAVETIERLVELKQLMIKASFTGFVQVAADQLGFEIEMPDFLSRPAAAKMHDDFEEVIFHSISKEIKRLEEEVNA